MPTFSLNYLLNNNSMKKLLTLIVVSILAFTGFAQTNSAVKAAADAAVKVFTWDTKTVEKGTMMFLDVPYRRDGLDTTEYLTLTVAKDKTKARPAFISMILPSNVVESNGVFIKFGNKELEKGNPSRVHFESCHNEICTARIIDGYIVDEDTKERVDIFQKLLDSTHVYFLFIYPDGSHKSVAVPLASFKQQYRSL